MKRNKGYGNPCCSSLLTAMLFAALLVISGCTEEVFEKEKTDARYISFQPWETVQTKGVALGEGKDLVNDKVTIFVNAFKYSGGWASLANTPEHYMPNIELTGDDTGANWSYSGTKEWPKEHNLTFFANTSNGATFVKASSAPFYPSYEITAGEDVMIATPVYDRTYYNAPGSSNAVELNMRHILAKVGFSAALSGSYTSVSGQDVIIKQIQLGGATEESLGVTALYMKANYVYNDGQWKFSIPVGNEKYESPITFTTSEAALTTTPKDLCSPSAYHFFIPQDVNKTLTAYVDYNIVSSDRTELLSTGTLSIDFNPYEKNDSKNWEAGVAYNYTIVLNPTTGGLDINSGVSNYDMASKTVSVDAHEWEQPLPLSAPVGWARVTIQGAPSWARFSGHIARSQTGEDIQDEAERYSQEDNYTFYVNFGNDPSTTLVRTLLVQFDENVSYSNEKFSDRQFTVDIEYFPELDQNLATIKAKETKTKPDKSFTCLQTKPFYVGKYGSYIATNYAYTKGLIMENFEESDMEIFYSDYADKLKYKGTAGGLKWWSSDTKAPFVATDYSDYDGLPNTNKLVTDVSLLTSAEKRFNTYAANYCRSKGTSWFLPSPSQLGFMMAANPSEVNASYPIEMQLLNAGYWSSVAVSTTASTMLTKSGDTRSPATPLINTYQRVRCAREVDLVVVANPVTKKEDGTVLVDLGGNAFVLDSEPSGGQNANWNFVTKKACKGDNQRLATLSELVMLFEMYEFIPAANRMGQRIYFVAERAGGNGNGTTIDFTEGIAPYPVQEASNGSITGSYRCVTAQ